MITIEDMLEDAHSRIHAATELDDKSRVRQLQGVIQQLESSGVAESDARAAFAVGKAWYEMPSGVSARVQCTAKWLELASALDSTNWLPVMYLAHLWYDEKEWGRALEQLARIPDRAFLKMSSLWDWRDIKVAEMGLACSLRMHDAHLAASWLVRYEDLLGLSTEEARLPPVFALEALKSLQTGELSQELIGVARRLFNALTCYGWGSWLDRELSSTLDALLARVN